MPLVFPNGELLLCAACLPQLQGTSNPRNLIVLSQRHHAPWRGQQMGTFGKAVAKSGAVSTQHGA